MLEIDLSYTSSQGTCIHTRQAKTKPMPCQHPLRGGDRIFAAQRQGSYEN